MIAGLAPERGSSSQTPKAEVARASVAGALGFFVPFLAAARGQRVSAGGQRFVGFFALLGTAASGDAASDDASDDASDVGAAS